jgi:hypothetical protein
VKLGCEKGGRAWGIDHGNTNGVQNGQYIPALTFFLKETNFHGFYINLFETLRRERETGYDALLTCGMEGTTLGYLSEVARGPKTSSKFTFWAAKPTKCRRKQTKEGEEEVSGGGRHCLLPCRRCRKVDGDREKGGHVTTG